MQFLRKLSNYAEKNQIEQIFRSLKYIQNMQFLKLIFDQLSSYGPYDNHISWLLIINNTIFIIFFLINLPVLQFLIYKLQRRNMEIVN